MAAPIGQGNPEQIIRGMLSDSGDNDTIESQDNQTHNATVVPLLKRRRVERRAESDSEDFHAGATSASHDHHIRNAHAVPIFRSSDGNPTPEDLEEYGDMLERQPIEVVYSSDDEPPEDREINSGKRNYRLWFLAGVISVAVIVILGGWGISGLVEHGPDTYPAWWNSAITSAGHDGCWALAVLGTALGSIGLVISLGAGFDIDKKIIDYQREKENLEKDRKSLYPLFVKIDEKKVNSSVSKQFSSTKGDKLFCIQRTIDQDGTTIEIYIKDKMGIKVMYICYESEKAYIKRTLLANGWKEAKYL